MHWFSLSNDPLSMNKLLKSLNFHKHRQLTQFSFQRKIYVNSLPDSGDFSRLPITFPNSLDPDQDRQGVGHDFDPNRLTPW